MWAHKKTAPGFPDAVFLVWHLIVGVRKLTPTYGPFQESQVTKIAWRN